MPLPVVDGRIRFSEQPQVAQPSPVCDLLNKRKDYLTADRCHTIVLVCKKSRTAGCDQQAVDVGERRRAKPRRVRTPRPPAPQEPIPASQYMEGLARPVFGRGGPATGRPLSPARRAAGRSCRPRTFRCRHDLSPAPISMGRRLVGGKPELVSAGATVDEVARPVPVVPAVA